MPIIITKITVKEERMEDHIPKVLPAINIEAIVIRNGKRPLQGTKLLVSIAINLSLGESIILVPTTPAALQPNPHTHS